MRKTKQKSQPVSKFTVAFGAICYDKGWRLPDAYVTQVYEAGLIALEARIAELTGNRSSSPQRINPLQQPKKGVEIK